MTPDTPVVLPGAVHFDLADPRQGTTLRVFLRCPPGEAPADGWPVLYLLDGNAVFATALDALRAQAPYPLATGVRDAVVVGLGYPTDAAYDGLRRSWDYVPPPGATYPPFSAGGPLVRTGGADGFLDFVTGTVMPAVGARVAIDPARRALFGHSFGGLCVLYALFTRPDAFTHWIAASPSIAWEDAVVLRAAAAYEARAARPPAHVLLSAGGYEAALAPFQVGAPDEVPRRAALAQNRTVAHAHELAVRLDRLEGVRGRFQLIPDETHMSVLPCAVNQAIRFALGAEV